MVAKSLQCDVEDVGGSGFCAFDRRWVKLRLLGLHGKSKLLGPGILLGLALIPGRGRDGNESLGLANGAALFKLNKVPNFELVGGVVSLVLLLHPVPALVLWVHCEADNLDGDSLVVGGADHAALHDLHSPNCGEESGLGSGDARRGL
nr:hypothetical protein DVH24_000211 [Ipomoea batatas]